MSDHRQLRQGETPKTIRARAFTAGEFVDLSGYTGLAYRMVGPVTVEGSAVGDADGYLEVTFTDDDLDELGDYEMTFTGTDADGEPRTFPEATNLRVKIIAAL